MNLDHLKSFFVTAESKSISKAAKKLHLTQPGLSMQIQSLENIIGADLLIRSNKGVELTDEGRIVFEHASSMLSLESSIHKNIKDLKTKNNILSISSCNCLGAYFLPCRLYTFKEIYPDLKVSLEVSRTRNVIKRLLNHEANIGILTSKYDVPGLSIEALLEDNLILVSSPNPKYKSIRLEDLKSIPLIIHSEDSSLNKVLYESLERSNLSQDDLNIVLTMNSSESIKSTITSGHGFAFLPSITVRKELRSGALNKVKVNDLDTKFNYYFAYRENHDFTLHEERFKKYLLSRKQCFCS